VSTLVVLFGAQERVGHAGKSSRSGRRIVPRGTGGVQCIDRAPREPAGSAGPHSAAAIAPASRGVGLQRREFGAQRTPLGSPLDGSQQVRRHARPRHPRPRPRRQRVGHGSGRRRPPGARARRAAAGRRGWPPGGRAPAGAGTSPPRRRGVGAVRDRQPVLTVKNPGSVLVP
jgi:hypothetical protein